MIFLDNSDDHSWSGICCIDTRSRINLHFQEAVQTKRRNLNI